MNKINPNPNSSTYDGRIGHIDGSMDTKIGDLVRVRAVEGRRVGHDLVEVDVVHTIMVESVDDFIAGRWCKGPIVETTSTATSQLGRVFPVFLGHL